MAIHYTKTEFNTALGRLRATANQNTLDLNAIILGGAQLYFEHKFNTGYVERAMQVVRNMSGIRVNAVRAFFVALTGVNIPKRATGKPLKKGTLTEAPQALLELDDWLQWADEEAAEPAYDHKAVQLKLVKYLEKQQENATDHNDGELAETVRQMIALAAAPKKMVLVKAVA